MSKKNVQLDYNAKMFKHVHYDTPKCVRGLFQREYVFYKEKCAYNHKRILHGHTVNDDAIQEDVKNLKTEVEFLKNTINSLVSIREEYNIIEHYVKDIKKEINLLSAENKEVEKRIKSIEDDLTDESDDESEGIKGQQTLKDHVKKTDFKLQQKRGAIKETKKHQACK